MKIGGWRTRSVFERYAIVSRSDNLRQLTHSLDTHAALHRHHLPDLVGDAFSPELPFRWRRASTFCKAPLKKIHFHNFVRQHTL